MRHLNPQKPKYHQNVRRNLVAAVAVGIVANAAFVWALGDAIRPVETVVALASELKLVAGTDHEQRSVNLGRLPELIVRGERI